MITTVITLEVDLRLLNSKDFPNFFEKSFVNTFVIVRRAKSL